MKSTLRTIMICACSIYYFAPSIVYAQDSEGETVTIDGANYYTEMPVRFFLNYNDIGERLGFYSAGGWQLKSSGLDVESNLSKDDQKKWSDELCESYIYPECLKILNNNSKNATISFVLGILNFTGILHSNRSKNTNFLDPDLEKSKYFVNRAADLGLPDALNFRALMNGVDWGKALDQDDFQEPPSVELDLKAAVGKNYNPAKLNLAALYMGRKKYDEARVIYEDISKNEMAEGDIALGVIYLAGYGVSRDFVKAREYFSKALTKKSAMGNKVSYNLGMMYFKGHGGSVDYKLASQWVGYAASTNDKLELAVAALPRIDQARQAAADKLKQARAVLPKIDQAKQNEANIMAAISALRPGESVQITVPARPSSPVQNDPRYNPNCPEKYVALDKNKDRFSLRKLEMDIFVLRMPDYANFYYGHVDRINAMSTYKNKLSVEKPVISCLSEVADNLVNDTYQRWPVVTCYNNYTGNTYNSLEGEGVEMDSDGYSGNIKSCTNSSCFIIQDKNGKQFLYRWYSGQAYNWWNPDEFNAMRDKNYLIIEDGLWKGGLTKYKAFWWRKYQGNIDIIIMRQNQYGYVCTMNPQSSGNF